MKSKINAPNAPMDDARFAHMLKLASIYIGLFQTREFFDGAEEWTNSEKENSLTCMEIVAETFIEMQRRLGAKPIFRMKAKAVS
jgi:hypothetical protein